MAAMPPAAGPPIIGLVLLLGPPSWHELYESTDHVFSALVIPYMVLSAALFNSMDPPDTLLTRLKRMSLELPVIVALIADEALDWISLMKNPHQFVGNLLNPLILDRLVCGFTGPASEQAKMSFGNFSELFFHISEIFFRNSEVCSS